MIKKNVEQRARVLGNHRTQSSPQPRPQGGEGPRRGTEQRPAPGGPGDGGGGVEGERRAEAG